MASTSTSFSRVRSSSCPEGRLVDVKKQKSKSNSGSRGKLIRRSSALFTEARWLLPVCMWLKEGVEVGTKVMRNIGNY